MIAVSQSGDEDDATVTRAWEKALDGLAWLIASVGLCAGLLCVSAVSLFSAAWLFSGRSFRSLVWALTDPNWLGGMALALTLVSGLGLSAIAPGMQGAAALLSGLDRRFRCEVRLRVPGGSRARRGA